MEDNTNTKNDATAPTATAPTATETATAAPETTTTSTNNNDDVENPKDGARETWSGSLEFLMSCITLSIGLGNIWRFPFTAYENGGGVFLIPYIIVLFIIGKPMYYLEALIGQFSSRGPIKYWAICPAFFGISIGETYAMISVMTYYSSLVSLTIYYLIVSFNSVLPWSYCRDEWAGFCVDSAPSTNENDTRITFNDSQKLQSSSELYFLKIVLREYDDISNGIGLPSWRLMLTLLASWIITYAVTVKGIKSLGKASYFLAIFPYVVLISLLIHASTLEGAADGIVFFLKPKWSELLNITVWKEAVTQCFFSLSVCFGPIVAFSSYNKFTHNVYRDAMIITTLDTFTSLMAGIAIFAILGNLAFNLGKSEIDEVVQSGTGLAFVSYPDAISKFKAVPQLFAVLFFLMLFILGIGSLATLHNSTVTIVCDVFKLQRKWLVSLFVAIFGFGIGIVYVTPAGQWILNLVDYSAATFVIFFLAAIEVIAVSWIYGLQNFCDDIEFMTNRKVSLYWRLCWGFLTPVVLIVIFIYTLAVLKPLTYSGLEYPLSADIAGYVLMTIGFAQCPIWAIWYFFRNKKSSFLETIKKGLAANEKWGPADPKIKSKWLIYKQELRERRNKERESKKLSMFKQKLYYFFGCSK